METIVITSEADLKRIIREAVKEELTVVTTNVKKENSLPDESLMTRAEIARYLKISLVTLGDWVKKGLPCIRKGGRVLFQKSEVLAAIKGRPEKKKT